MIILTVKGSIRRKQYNTNSNTTNTTDMNVADVVNINLIVSDAHLGREK